MGERGLRELWNALPPGRRAALLALFLLIVSLGQYALTIGHPLIWDSKLVLTDTSVHSLANIGRYFTEPAIPPAEAEGVQALPYYRPLVKLFSAVEYGLFGEAPAGYHALAVLANGLVVLALHRLLRSLFRGEALPFWATLLYAVNPARGEGVCWVFGASTVLMSLAVLVALDLHVRGRRRRALAVYAVALLCRETAVLLPAVVLLLELLPSERPRGRNWRRAIPYAGLALAFVAARSVVLGEAPPFTDVAPLPLANTCVVILKRFLKIAFLPDAAVAIYPREVFHGLGGEVIASWIVLILVGFGVRELARSHRPLVLWALWPALWLSIWCNVGRFGDYLMNEKALYLAVAGLCVVGASLALRCRRGAALLVLVVAVHFGVTLWRSTFWRDEIVYLERAAAFAPDHGPVRLSAGLAHADRGHYAAAAAHLAAYLETAPDSAPALTNLGNCHHALGRTAEARAAWHAALEQAPEDHRPAYNLGLLAVSDGDRATALSLFRRARDNSPAPIPGLEERIRMLEADEAK